MKDDHSKKNTGNQKIKVKFSDLLKKNQISNANTNYGNNQDNLVEKSDKDSLIDYDVINQPNM